MSLTNEVCVVTGACGFLGKKLVRLLLEEEKLAEIRLLDKNIQPQVVRSFDDCKGGTKVSVFEGDIRDGQFLRKACRGASLVFHIASIIDVQNKVKYSEMHSVNVTGTELLLDACFQENVVSFIYTSTVEVMGPNPKGEPIINGCEESVYKSSLKFAYSKTKKQAEDRTLEANGKALQNGSRMATCALRPMYIYGEGCRFLLSHMRDGIKNMNVLLRMSVPEAKVNPVYVGNVALAHLQAARGLKDPRKVKNIGGNFYFISDNTPHVSYSDFNHAVMAPLGFHIQEKIFLPLSILYIFCYIFKIMCMILRPFKYVAPPLSQELLTMLNTPFSFSYQKAKKDLEYIPRYSWEESRKLTIEWLSSKLPQEREKIWGR